MKTYYFFPRKVVAFLFFCFLFVAVQSTVCIAQLVVYNSGVATTIQSGLTVTIKGGFTNQVQAAANGSVDNQGILEVSENWTNNVAANNVFTTTAGTVNLNSTTVGQTIGGSTATNFYNLTLNNTFVTSPQFTLGISTPVLNTLTMTSGNTNLAGYTLTLGTAVGTPGTLSYTAGFLYGNTGTFTRWISATSAAMGAIAANELGHFPMGESAGSYRPLWLRYSANLTAGGTVSVLHDGTTLTTAASHNDASWSGGTIVAAVTNSFWTVSSANSFAFNGATGDVRYGGQGYGTSTLTDLDATLVASVVGTFGAATSVNTTIEVNRTALTTAQLANSWRIGTKNTTQSPLPITLLSFDAKPNGDNVDLKWKTATETNNDYFTIEKSKDGSTFEFVAKLTGAGNSYSILNYSTIDDNPYKGVSYYRLKQTDYDGKFSYSNIIAVEFNPNNTSIFSVYPNPINTGGTLNLSITGKIGEEVVVVVHDVIGKENYSKVVVLQTEGDNVYVIDESNRLAAGVYFITATSNQTIYSKKLIVK